MTELEAYRREIDAIDGELTRLFLRRMEVTGRVGAYKQAHGLPVLDAAREKDVLARKAELARDKRPRPTSPPCTRPSWASPGGSSVSW